MPEPAISSRQNPRVKQACALRSRQQRDQTCQALVDGVRESARACAAGAKVMLVFYCPALFRAPEANEVVNRLASNGAELLEVTTEVFEKLAYGDRMDGLVSIVATRSTQLANLKLSDRPLISVIERVEKPGNLGAILRTADGAGIDAVVVADPVIDLFNPNTIRASVAGVFRPNVATASVGETLAWLRSAGLAMWAARPDAQTKYYELDYTQPGAIVLGNEAEGLSETWNASDITPVALPMHGIADSLNVSATAAVLFYEARRQRDQVAN
ncbi:MAG: TrmH family RNA methyltransferase [Aeoliella sp.]